ncbi:MAG: PD40 domain-containing protein [Deltaproteobacteria bacterium]|nr:PD40 domain-containing protein [Deltaproteobacteria bacterium]MBN2673212.1 PD40 domain-containing protein [Deltaproteobacteria bacterium]
MMRRATRYCLHITTFIWIIGCGSGLPTDARQIAQPPQISPDYTGTVIPPNIAPLNFAIEEKGDDFVAHITGYAGDAIVVRSRTGDIRIPEDDWKTLLAHNKGKILSFVVYVFKQHRWHRFKAIQNRVAEESIDSHLVYRWMRSLHHFHERFYIVERSLDSFHEKTVLDNKSIGGGCMNCHTFLNGHTDTMTYQIRSSEFGLPMVLVQENTVTPVNTRTAGFSTSPAAFTSWHPSGELIAFSVNKVSPFEHTVGQTRGEWDDNSDLAVYHVAENRVTSNLGISDPSRRESWPAWSADGKRLYFSSAPKLPRTEFRKVRYDLMQISFDSESEEWGSPQVLISSDEAEMSLVEPRVSPDGKWVVFCGCEYGHMACFLKSSDLYVLNTDTGKHHELNINSRFSESWPSWSSNGRWIMFVSKRRDGLMSHVYFSYFDKNGQAHKPFILPQEDPRYYDSCAKTYNRPELAVEPIQITGSDLAKGICNPETKREPPKAFDRAVTKPSNAASGNESWRPVAEKSRGAH